MKPELEALHQEGQAAWERSTIPFATFRELVLRRNGSLENVLSAELFLSVALELQLASALEVFESELLPKLLPALKRVERDPRVLEEVLQRLRVRCFVGDGEQPARITSFHGQGTLASWLRVVALRLHADLLREQQAQERLAKEPDVAPPPRSVERVLLAQQHGETLQAALRSALAELPAKERTLLRMHYLEGIALDRIAVLHGVHKATISRWMQNAREALLERCVHSLRAQLEGSAGTEELESLCRALCSQIEVSLSVFERSVG